MGNEGSDGEFLRSIILHEVEITCTDHYIRGKPVPPEEPTFLGASKHPY